jgi:hypothetical protein
MAQAGCAVSSELRGGRPIGQHRRRRRRLIGEFSRAVNGAAIDNGENRFQAAVVLLGHVEVVLAEHGEVGELAHGQTSLVLLLAGEPSAAHGVEAQRLLARKSIRFGVKRQAADCAAAHQPVQRVEGVVVGDACGIGSRSDRNTYLQLSSIRRMGGVRSASLAP